MSTTATRMRQRLAVEATEAPPSTTMTSPVLNPLFIR